MRGDGGDWEWMAWAFETSQPVPNDTRAQLLILPQTVSLTGEQLFKHVNPGGSGDGVGCGWGVGHSHSINLTCSSVGP